MGQGFGGRQVIDDIREEIARLQTVLSARRNTSGEYKSGYKAGVKKMAERVLDFIDALERERV